MIVKTRLNRVDWFQTALLLAILVGVFLVADELRQTRPGFHRHFISVLNCEASLWFGVVGFFSRTDHILRITENLTYRILRFAAQQHFRTSSQGRLERVVDTYLAVPNCGKYRYVTELPDLVNLVSALVCSRSHSAQSHALINWYNLLQVES